MPEIRQNMATKEWVIVSTERAKRPEQFKKQKPKEAMPEFNKDCPFCPGNESLTPYEMFVINDNAGKWKIRAIPNKFPALVSEGPLEREIRDIHRKISGVGVCEVIIESPIHNTTVALMPEYDITQILQVYKNRFENISRDPRIKLVTIFRNHGELAGASLVHPHSQIVATPVVPFGIRNRLEEAVRFYDETGDCAYCKMLQAELQEKARIVTETGSFVAFIPYAALSPFHIWILPKKHVSSFDETSDMELNDLAKNLKTTLAKLYYGLEDPDYNYIIRTAPLDDKQNEYYHWYLTIVPRVIKTAGFELGTGMSINTSYPEESAKYLREIKIR